MPKPKLIIIAIPLVVIILFQLLKTESYPIKNSPASLESVLSFGDSLTFGTGSSKNMSYPSQLARRLDIEIINMGKPGETTASALLRLDKALEHEASIVLLTLGGNDLKNGVSSQNAKANLISIITRFQDQGAMVVLGGVKIPLYDKGYEKVYQTVAKETGSILIPNVLEDILADKQLMSDPIHPNAQGYAIMAERFYQAIEPHINPEY